MKGSIHAAIGASAPAGLVLTQHASFLQGATMAAISAGFALLPDLDHPGSCATKALGKPVHKLVHALSGAVLHATALRRDKASMTYLRSVRRDPVHRTLTHTLAASLAVWAAAYAAGWISIAAGGVAALGVLLLWPLYRRTLGLVVLGAAAVAVGAATLLTPWLLALAVGGGYASHVAADACTKSGVPAFWPLKIQGKRWWNVRLLGSLLTSGSSYESAPAVGVSMVANVVLLFLNF